jgi:predicted secreted Zn-dependent protease
MKVARRTVAAVLLAVALLPAIAADSLDLEYFDVHGSTARELREDLSRLGPVADNGVRGDAYTRWRINWKFDLTERGPDCIAGNFQVDLTVTMILPRWIPPAGASADLVALWDQYSIALRSHEDGHHRIALAAAQEVTRRLKAESRASGCKTLENKLKSTVDAVLLEYKGRQADYDRETDFGRARGTNVL